MKKEIVKKISLGTAQFGINYGINKKKMDVKGMEQKFNKLQKAEQLKERLKKLLVNFRSLLTLIAFFID